MRSLTSVVGPTGSTALKEYPAGSLDYEPFKRKTPFDIADGVKKGGGNRSLDPPALLLAGGSRESNNSGIYIESGKYVLPVVERNYIVSKF